MSTYRLIKLSQYNAHIHYSGALEG